MGVLGGLPGATARQQRGWSSGLWGMGQRGFEVRATLVGATLGRLGSAALCNVSGLSYVLSLHLGAVSCYDCYQDAGVTVVQ